MRYGFKAQAERLSLAVRDQLGLTPTCRLDPIELASANGIEVITLSALAGVPERHRVQLTETDPGALSGVSLIVGDKKLVVINDAHTAERQANTMSHEVAHFLLEHDPHPPFGEFGRVLSKDLEDEADWTAGCLLVPGSGIPEIMQRCDDDLLTAAAHYGVSLELMRWRHNVTGQRTAKSAA
jgi:Zn-dependent peptidase ImmA (M78 family)